MVLVRLRVKSRRREAAAVASYKTWIPAILEVATYLLIRNANVRSLAANSSLDVELQTPGREPGGLMNADSE